MLGRLMGALALVLLAAVPPAAADSWSSTGPTSGGVLAFAVDPGSPLEVYAASAGGVWRTADGSNWVKVLTAPSRDVAVAGGRIVVAADGGVWRSTDDGATWLLSAEGFRTAADRDVRSVALTGTTVYAGTQRSVMKSTDGGATWAPAESGLPNPSVARDLAVDGATVYAATEAGVYRSTDAAGSWSEPQALAGPVTSIAADPTTSGRLWAVQDGQIFRTPNIGSTGWTAAGGVTGARAVAVRPTAPIVVYAATDGGPRASDDPGTTWDPAPATLAGVPLGAIGAPPDGAPGGTVYASGDRDGLFRSANDGATWTATGPLSGTSIGAVAFEGGAAPTFWAGGASSVYRSLDRGATWQRRETGLPARPAIADLATDPRTPGTIYAAVAGAGVWRTSDGGGVWAGASSGLPSLDVRALAADPQTPGRVHAATADGVARSSNAGASWTAGAGLAGVSVRALAVDPASPSIVLAGTDGQGVWRSLDAGAGWSASNTGGLAGATVLALHAGSAVDLAGTAGGLFRSVDDGATWARITAGLPAGVVPSGFWEHPAVPSVLVLAAGNGGLYRSVDAGLTWYHDDLGLDALPQELAGDALTLVAATGGDGARVGALRPDLGLSAVAQPAPVVAGELVTITIGVRNGGPSPATGARVAVALPAGFAIRDAVPSQGTCTTAPVACDVGTLPVAGVATVTVVVRSTVAGSVPVTITASAAQPDRTPADDVRVLAVASTDTTAPRSLRMKGTTLQRPFQTGTDIQLGWSAVDSGTGVARYDVRYRKGTSAGTYAAATVWQSRTARTTALFSGAAGATYCFAVRAVDGAGNVSRYGTEKCTAIPFDDRVLSRRGAWSREASRTAFGGGTLKSARRGDTLILRNVRAKRISLLATTCRRCGTVEVRLGTRLLKTIDLNARTQRTRQILPALLATGIRRGTLTIRVVTDGRPVRIDGIGLSPR